MRTTSSATKKKSNVLLNRMPSHHSAAFLAFLAANRSLLKVISQLTSLQMLCVRASSFHLRKLITIIVIILSYRRFAKCSKKCVLLRT